MTATASILMTTSVNGNINRGGQAMKKMILSLAAIAALASCVEEKGLEPQNPAGNQVVIKATTDVTKTVISGDDPKEGLSVLWEDGDKIRVVFKKGDSYTESDFTTTLSESSDEADFAGTLDETVNVEAGYSNEGFAVYPASAWDAETSKLNFIVPGTQDGVVEEDENLASATVSLSALTENDEVKACFKNALALIRVYLPEGVASVTLTSDSGDLTGTPDFRITEGRIERTAASGQDLSKTVTLESAETLPSVCDVLVLPATVNSLGVKVTGTGGAVYEKNIEGKTFEASQCYTLDLTSLFQADPKEFYVSPAGGEFTYEMVTTEDFTYTVTGDPSWVSKVETKGFGFHSDKIVFTVEPNTGANDRQAEITVSLEDGRHMSVTLKQKNYYPELITDEDGNQVIWEETFTVAEDSDLTHSPKTFENKQFHFSLNEGDLSKGAYVIKGMFYTEGFTGVLGNISEKGGEYYADIEGEELTVYLGNDKQSYFFKSDQTVTMTYVKEESRLSSDEVIPANATNNLYIGNYEAVIKGSKQEETDVVKALFGTYRETFETYNWMINPGKTIISESDKLGYDLMIEFFKPNFTTSKKYIAYGNVNEEGTLITIDSFNDEWFGQGSISFDITVSGNNLSASIDFGLGDSFNYSAEKE